MPKRSSHQFRENAVYELPESAVDIVSREAGCSEKEARRLISELVKAGYFIAPRNPSNSMLKAYILSYGPLPKNPATVITAIGKARRRWQAMGGKGTALALSNKHRKKDTEEALLFDAEHQEEPLQEIDSPDTQRKPS